MFRCAQHDSAFLLAMSGYSGGREPITGRREWGKDLVDRQVGNLGGPAHAISRGPADQRASLKKSAPPIGEDRSAPVARNRAR